MRRFTVPFLKSVPWTTIDRLWHPEASIFAANAWHILRPIPVTAVYLFFMFCSIIFSPYDKNMKRNKWQLSSFIMRPIPVKFIFFIGVPYKYVCSRVLCVAIPFIPDASSARISFGRYLRAPAGFSLTGIRPRQHNGWMCISLVRAGKFFWLHLHAIRRLTFMYSHHAATDLPAVDVVS